MAFFADRLGRIKPSPTNAAQGKFLEMKAAGKDVIGLAAGLHLQELALRGVGRRGLDAAQAVGNEGHEDGASFQAFGKRAENTGGPRPPQHAAGGPAGRKAYFS